MGCNCGGNKKNGQRNVRRSGQRTISGPRQGALVGGQAARPTPTQVRALNAQNAREISASGMSKHRRDIERKRRLAILKKLGR